MYFRACCDFIALFLWSVYILSYIPYLAFIMIHHSSCQSSRRHLIKSYSISRMTTERWTWARQTAHSEPYQPSSFTVVAFPYMVAQAEFLVDWQHSCTPFVWPERRLMGQRALGMRTGETRGEMLAESPSPPLSRTENTTLPLCS